MERTRNIIRRSIFTLLKDFHYFSIIPLILLLPFSASILLYQSHSFLLVPRISFLDSNLHKVILRSIFNLPFAVSSLVIAKASIIQYLHHYNNDNKPTISSLYKPLVLTYLCNILLTIIINTATFFLLVSLKNFIEHLVGLSSQNPIFVWTAEVVIFMILANTTVICSLSQVIACLDNCSGYKAINKACLLRKEAKSMALLLILPINLGLTATESLFRYRILRAYDLLGWISLSMVVEGWLIANMFSLFVVLDTISCYLLIKNYESDNFRSVKEENNVSTIA